jgi:short-subunit dehydrogenase
MPGEKEEYTARGKKFRLNVASSAGMLPAGPFMTTHYATKAYAASFTRAVERKV